MWEARFCTGIWLVIQYHRPGQFCTCIAQPPAWFIPRDGTTLAIGEERTTSPGALLDDGRGCCDRHRYPTVVQAWDEPTRLRHSGHDTVLPSGFIAETGLSISGACFLSASRKDDVQQTRLHCVQQATTWPSEHCMCLQDSSPSAGLSDKRGAIQARRLCRKKRQHRIS